MMIDEGLRERRRRGGNERGKAERELMSLWGVVMAVCRCWRACRFGFAGGREEELKTMGDFVAG